MKPSSHTWVYSGLMNSLALRIACAAIMALVALALGPDLAPRAAWARPGDRPGDRHDDRAGHDRGHGKKGGEIQGDKKAAVKHLAEGDRKLARGDHLQSKGRIERAFAQYEEALSAYRAAYQAYPDPQIYFPIALAEQRLGRFIDALDHYRSLLDEEDLPPALREQVKAHLIEVKKNLAAVVFEVVPDGTQVLIDNKKVAESPMSQPVFIEPGRHTYALTRDGYTPVEGKVDLEPGKEMRKRVELERMPVVIESPQPHHPRAHHRHEAHASRVPLWVGLGVTGALAIAGAGTGIAALRRHSQYRDESLPDKQRNYARTRGQELARLTDVLLGGALVGAAVTAYYYYAVLEPSREQRPPADRAVEVVPSVGPGWAGVAALGRF